MPSTSSNPLPAPAITPASKTSAIESRCIHALGNNQWRGFLQWNSAAGNIEPVFDALVFDPIDAIDVTVCAKLYPSEDGRSRGMVNEITGWLVTHAMRLPQPERAFVLRVPIAELAAPLPPWIRTLKREKVKDYWAFATVKMPAQSAAIQFNNTDLPLLVDDIRIWPELPRAVVLDEHIANTDRHLNNLLRLGKGNYALIDNGRLAVEGSDRNWQTAHLKADRLYSNLLSQMCWNDRPNKDDQSLALGTGTNQHDVLGAVRAELEDWWRRLIPDVAERNAFRNFVVERAAALDALLKKRYGLLI